MWATFLQETSRLSPVFLPLLDSVAARDVFERELERVGAGPTLRIPKLGLPHPSRVLCERVGPHSDLEFLQNGAQAQTLPTPTLPAFHHLQLLSAHALT